MKEMRVITEGLPEGMALLCMDDNGWVGTNNGSRYTGQPAMFPLEQAEAIAYAWHFLMDKGVKVFPKETTRAEVSEFPGLALFDLVPVSEQTLRWMDNTVRVP